MYLVSEEKGRGGRSSDSFLFLCLILFLHFLFMNRSKQVVISISGKCEHESVWLFLIVFGVFLSIINVYLSDDRFSLIYCWYIWNRSANWSIPYCVNERAMHLMTQATNAPLLSSSNILLTVAFDTPVPVIYRFLFSFHKKTENLSEDLRAFLPQITYLFQSNIIDVFMQICHLHRRRHPMTRNFGMCWF
jgi:hypothetical protein